VGRLWGREHNTAHGASPVFLASFRLASSSDVSSTIEASSPSDSLPEPTIIASTSASTSAASAANRWAVAALAIVCLGDQPNHSAPPEPDPIEDVIVDYPRVQEPQPLEL